MKRLAALLIGLAVMFQLPGAWAVTADNDRQQVKGVKEISYRYDDPGRRVRWGDISIAFTGGIHSRLENFPELGSLMRDISPYYKNNTFVLDAGDFSGDSVYDSVYAEAAPELSMMAYLGYDAAALGDRERAHGEKTLKRMLRAAGNEPAAISGGYRVFEKNGRKIAVFGVSDISEAGKTVDDIGSREEGIDLVVCLSQVGEDKEELLAEEAPGIDLIISGDRKKKLEKPLRKGNTLIVSAGCDAGAVGHIDFFSDSGGEYTNVSYDIKEVTSETPADEGTAAELKKYTNLADRKYEEKYGFKASRTLARSGTDIGAMGELVADSYVYADKKADCAIVPEAAISGKLLKGKIRAIDAYEAVADKQLLAFYVKKSELRSLVSLAAESAENKIYFAGVSYTVNDRRIKFNRAVDISAGEKELYRVVTDTDTVDMLQKAAEDSWGILSFALRDEDGAVVTDRDRLKIGLSPKRALAAYLAGFDNVPDSYAGSDGRVKMISSLNPYQLLRQPNKAGCLLIAAIVLPILIIIAVILIIVIRRRRRRNNMMFHISERQKKAIFAPPKKNRKIFSGRRSRGRNRRYR